MFFVFFEKPNEKKEEKKEKKKVENVWSTFSDKI